MNTGFHPDYKGLLSARHSFIHSGNSKTFWWHHLAITVPILMATHGLCCNLIRCGLHALLPPWKFWKLNYVTAQVHHDYYNEKMPDFFWFHSSAFAIYASKIFQLFCHLCHNAKGGWGRGGSGAVFSLLCGYLFNKLGKSFFFLGEKS